MVDAFFRNDEVVGSSPTSYTNLSKHLPGYSANGPVPLITGGKRPR